MLLYLFVNIGTNPVVFLCSTSKRAGVFLLLTGGRIQSNTEGQCTTLLVTHAFLSVYDNIIDTSLIQIPSHIVIV